MKRCPQCDFIYENDQSLCDMDESELVYDPRPLAVDPRPLAVPDDPSTLTVPDPGRLAVPQNTATQAADRPAKSQWRRWAVLPVAGVILGGVLSVVYHVFTHRIAPQKADQSSVKATAGPESTPNPVFVKPAVTPTPSPIRLPIANAKAASPSSQIESPSTRHSRSASSKQEEKKAKRENANQNKESRVDSILRKTGRILKKPFKF